MTPRGPGRLSRIYVVEDELGQTEAYDVGVDGLALPAQREALTT